MHKYVLIISTTFFVIACSSTLPGDPEKPISAISVVYEGKNTVERPGMASVCKGFYISDREVNDFYSYSAMSPDNHKREIYKVLPCYAQGTAAINGISYHWTIRAGGIGEFYNDNEYFAKICGKDCCHKLPGIC